MDRRNLHHDDVLIAAAVVIRRRNQDDLFTDARAHRTGFHGVVRPAVGDGLYAEVGRDGDLARTRVVASRQLRNRSQNEEGKRLVEGGTQRRTPWDEGEIAAGAETGLDRPKQGVPFDQPVHIGPVHTVGKGHGKDPVIRPTAGNGLKHLNLVGTLRRH